MAELLCHHATVLKESAPPPKLELLDISGIPILQYPAATDDVTYLVSHRCEIGTRSGQRQAQVVASAVALRSRRSECYNHEKGFAD